MQRNRSITPEQLIDKITPLLPDAASGERAVVMELSEQSVRCVILKMTAFCGYRREAEYPLPTAARDLGERTGSLRRDRLSALLGAVIYELPPQITAGFVVGTWATDPLLIEALQRFFRAGFVSLNEDEQAFALPPRDQLRQALERSRGQALHTLNLVVAGVNEYDRKLEQDRIMLYSPTPPGEALDPRVPMATIQLIPPALNQPLLLMFEETPLGELDANRGIYYWAVAKKSPFTLTIKFDPSLCDWTIALKPDEAYVAPRDDSMNWSGERSVYELTDAPPMPDEIELSEGLPNVVIVVESTLGMQRAYNTARSNVVEKTSTDFAVVRMLCEQIIHSLYYITDLRFMLLFYGSHQPKPSEFFRSVELPSANPVVTHLPNPDGDPCFVTADALLAEVKANFAQMQTASKTWHKSADEAMHELNDDAFPWDHSDRVVIWIAQSPPFEYGGGDEMPVNAIGFRGKYSLRTELVKLTDPNRTKVKNLVFLIKGDTPQRLLPLSRKSWLNVVGNQQGRLFEVIAADESDAQLSDDADNALRSLAEFNRRRIVRNVSDTPLQLPFVYDPYNPLTYLENCADD